MGGARGKLSGQILEWLTDSRKWVGSCGVGVVSGVQISSWLPLFRLVGFFSLSPSPWT